MSARRWGFRLDDGQIILNKDGTKRCVCLSGTVDASALWEAAGFGIILRVKLRITRNLLYRVLCWVKQVVPTCFCGGSVNLGL